jgi:uncharacterized protein
MAFRVLTLDGGGAWALIEVRMLMKLYGDDATGHQVLSNFDLVAANSAGSLVLAGMVENLPLSDILKYFMDEGKRKALFQKTTKVFDEFIEHFGVGPKFSESGKLPAIESLLPDTGRAPLAGCMRDVIGPNKMPVHLLIVAFDYDRECAVFLRSAPAKREGWGEGQPADVSLAGAVHASTNAPVNYFDDPAAIPNVEQRYWDGGITGCNNPAVVAVVESAVLGHAPTDVHVLSLGTGSVSRPVAIGEPDTPFETARDISSLPTDIKKLAMAILDDPPDAASFIAHVITGGNIDVPQPAVSRVVRMSPLVSPLLSLHGKYLVPGTWNVERFAQLCNLDMDALEQIDVVLIYDYCSVWFVDKAPNQPIRANGTKFDPDHPEIGYATFSDARAAWEVLFPPLVST